MRWVIIKLVNLVIVLLIVTFLVAAIFTGPLAQRERQNIAQMVQASVKDRFRGATYMVVIGDCINRVGVQEFNKSVDNVTAEIKASPQQMEALTGLSDEQKASVVDAIGAAYKEVVSSAIRKGTKMDNNQLLNEVVSNAKSALEASGIEVSEKSLKDMAQKIAQNIVEECRQKIVNDEVRIKIHQLGLDKPWFILSLKYTKMLLTFQPMNSNSLTTQYWPYQGSRNVMDIILERLPFSISLFTTSSILTLLIAMPLALVAARRPGGILDSVIMSWSVFSVSMPWWWLAMVFIYFFTVKYNIFPSPLKINPNWGALFMIDDAIFGRVPWSEVTTGIVQIAKAAALPVFTVTVLSIGDTAYRIRNILIDIFNEDFVTVARAKGVPEHLVLRKHVMRPAAPPLVTIVLFSIVLSVFAGAIITELIFNWYGLGRLYWDAIEKNDIPVILELTYITTLLYLVIRFILDILYTLLDPRIRRA